MTTTKSTYRADADDLTVYRIDAHGEYWDLNAEGAAIHDASELADFIHELHEVGTFDASTRDELLDEIA